MDFCRISETRHAHDEADEGANLVKWPSPTGSLRPL